MSTLIATIMLSSTLCLAPAQRTAPAPETSARDDDQDADAAALLRRDADGSYYVFGEEELTGEVLSPEGQLIPWRRPARFESLISIRGHFNPELLKLALDL
jgi:hypothetical protein